MEERFSEKRITPNLTIYNPTTGVSSNLVMGGYTEGVVRATVNVASTNWTFTVGITEFVGLGNSATHLISTAVGGAILQPYSVINFHYVLDARLGIT